MKMIHGDEAETRYLVDYVKISNHQHPAKNKNEEAERNRIMGKVYAFVANGSEEVELLAVVMYCSEEGRMKLVSVTGSRDG